MLQGITGYQESKEAEAEGEVVTYAAYECGSYDGSYGGLYGGLYDCETCDGSCDDLQTGRTYRT